MDLRVIPLSEQRLWAEEVLYLHSLWHQGSPPKPNPNPNRNNKKRKNSEIEWPVNPASDASADFSSWPDTAPKPNPNPNPKPVAICPQRAALEPCRKFLSRDDSSEEEDEEDADEEESKSFDFFLAIFERDGELRGYYEKNQEKGEFLCLVCGGIRVKVGKSYSNCVGLVQHSTAISKTKRRGAHRGFGRAVCRVLGWNISRLPSIVLDVGQPSGKPSDKGDKLKKVKDGNGELLIDSGEHPDIRMKDKKKQQMPSPSSTPAEVTAQVQQNVLKACHDFLSKSDPSSSDDEGDGEEMDKCESVDFEFFSSLFDMHCDLRSYYEKNYSKGEFSCLVCGAIGMKKLKKFRDCAGLLEHSKYFSKVKRKRAHRAFGKAVCQVLGWDINRMKAIIHTPKESFGDLPKLQKVKDGNGELLIDSGEHPEIRKKAKKEHQMSSPSYTPAQNVLKACHDFLSKSDSPSSDDEGDEEEMNKRESVDFEFFSSLFDKDCDLRSYYEKNYSKREFCCLVCGAIGAKKSKKFRDCAGLVHHSKSVPKARRKRAHRAFGRAVCQVLGWDINRMKTIIHTPKKSLT